LGNSIQVPGTNIALPCVVVSHGNRSAVGSESHRMPLARGDLHDVCPATDIALSVAVVPDDDHGAVGPKAYRVEPTCGDLDDVCPADTKPTALLPAQVIVARFAAVSRAFLDVSSKT